LRDRERWKLGKKLREELKPFPLILSGGLNPENISEAIHNVRPFAVDVSSGVEAKPGIKDGRKMKQFIHTARIAAKS
jgi:phosphoribosylanthranilate isomerase